MFKVLTKVDKVSNTCEKNDFGTSFLYFRSLTSYLHFHDVSFFFRVPMGSCATQAPSVWSVAMGGGVSVACKASLSPTPGIGHTGLHWFLQKPQQPLTCRVAHRLRGAQTVPWQWVRDRLHTHDHQHGDRGHGTHLSEQHTHWDPAQCNGLRHKPPVWGQPFCSAEQLLPPGNQPEQLLLSEKNQAGVR